MSLFYKIIFPIFTIGMIHMTYHAYKSNDRTLSLLKWSSGVLVAGLYSLAVYDVWPFGVFWGRLAGLLYGSLSIIEYFVGNDGDGSFSA